MESDGVYVISVVSRMLQMHPQTLRKYERAGLVRPSRTDGMLRLYSEADVQRLRLIKHLVEDLGLNLAGVELVLRMRERLEGLRSRAMRMAITDAGIESALNELLLTLDDRKE
jgi:MerR family transcriptional regulator, heat shock protein HspR